MRSCHFSYSASLSLQHTQVVLRRLVCRVKSQSFFIISLGFLEITFPLKHCPPVVISLRIFGIEPNCLCIVYDGLIVIAFVNVCISSAFVGVCIPRINLNSLVVVRYGSIIVRSVRMGDPPISVEKMDPPRVQWPWCNHRSLG